MVRRNRFTELDIVPLPPRPRRVRKPVVKHAIKLTKAGSTIAVSLQRGHNSFGEPDIFAGKAPARGRKEFKGLRGQPLYAIQQWAVSNGYTYEVT